MDGSSKRAVPASRSPGPNFDPDGSSDRGTKTNVLTRVIDSSELGQGCSARSCRVEVERSGALPDLRGGADRCASRHERNPTMPYPLDMCVSPEVTAFFDPTTNTISYVVKDPRSDACAIVDFGHST